MEHGEEGTPKHILEYYYAIKGVLYKSSRKTFGLWDRHDETRYWLNFATGTGILVNYKPSNPKVAVLEPGARIGDNLIT